MRQRPAQAVVSNLARYGRQAKIGAAVMSIASDAQVIIAGRRCSIAGRVSMDLIAVDVTDLPDGHASRGGFATLIGRDLDVDQVATSFGTMSYEVLTSLGRRYHRIYKGVVKQPE